MAITSLDLAVAGRQWPRTFAKVATGASSRSTLWALAGNPGAGAYDTTLNGVVLSGTAANILGQIPFTDPVSGETKLFRLQAAATGVAGTLIAADRLWHNGGINATLTTAQTIASPTWSARDATGTTNGVGVLLAVEVSAVTGVGTPTITIGYTNSAGTAGRTATNVESTTNTAVTGTFYRIGLQAGDIGVRSVQSITLSATWTSGTINLVAYTILAQMELPNVGVSNALDIVTSGAPVMFSGAVPYFMYTAGSATAASVTGSMVWTQG